MLNILPQQNKDALKKEYSVRRIVVFLGSAIAVLVVSLILLVPSYFTFYIRSGQAKVQLEEVKHTLDVDLKNEDSTAELNQALRHVADLKPFSSPTSVYDLVRIFESKSSAIKIYSLNFLAKKDDVPAKISIRGTATDRESLKSFGRAIEGRVEFESVILPVSNFVKETNIDFTMTVEIK